MWDLQVDDLIVIKILIWTFSREFRRPFFPFQLAGTRCQREEDRAGQPPGVELTAVVGTGGDD